MDNNFLFLCVLQVTLANESIVLYMCEGKVLMDKLFFILVKHSSNIHPLFTNWLMSVDIL